MTAASNAALSAGTPGLPTARLHICSLATVHDTLAASKAAHLITVINGQTMLDTPAGIEARRHLKIAVNDISVPQEGLVHPAPEHIEQILRFARDWDHDGDLVVHCWAGISRSSAAAFISACELNEPGKETRIAEAIRAASRTATPNKLMVALADDVMRRRGRMVDAIKSIGTGEMAMAGTPFFIPSRFY